MGGLMSLGSSFRVSGPLSRQFHKEAIPCDPHRENSCRTSVTKRFPSPSEEGNIFSPLSKHPWSNVKQDDDKGMHSLSTLGKKYSS
jgi:hypothetical protein